MSDDTPNGRQSPTSDRYRRRDVLGAIGTVGVTTLAGCASDGGDQGAGPGNSPGSAGSGSGTPTGECPSPPFSYGRTELSHNDQVLASAEIPMSRAHAVETGPGRKVNLGDVAVTVGALNHGDSTVDEHIGIYGLRDVTDQYDVPSEAAVAADDRWLGVPQTLSVLFPTETRLVAVVATFRGNVACVEPVTAVQERAITSARLV